MVIIFLFIFKNKSFIDILHTYIYVFFSRIFVANKTMVMYDGEQDMRIYCLEGMGALPGVSVETILAQWALDFGLTSIHGPCESMEMMESYWHHWVREDRQSGRYPALYFVVGGHSSVLEVDGYQYDLYELADAFEGKLTGKRLHFANTKQLVLDEETAQYVLDVTGAQSISGYAHRVPLLSFDLDGLFFALSQQYASVVELTEVLHEKQYAACKMLGFTLYY